MVRASALLDGITAPVDSGFSNHERMNCISSSRRRVFLATRTAVCDGIAAMSRGRERAELAQKLRGIGGKAEGQDGSSVWLPRFPNPSRNSFTRLKKPEDSG